MLQQIEREDPALVERLEQPDPDMRRFQGRPWPAAARRFRLTRAGERELARLRGEDPDEDWDDEGDDD